MELTLVASLSVVALLLFFWGRPRYDLVAIGILAALLLCKLLTPAEAFSHIASPSVISIVSLYVMGRALVKTGVIPWIGRKLRERSGSKELLFLVLFVLPVGLLSGFVFNVFVVTALLPIVLGATRDARISPSRVLIPMAFAVLLGGTLSLVGNPMNLGLQGLLQSSTFQQKYPGIAALDFFSFALPGLAILCASAIYFVLVGRTVLPQQELEGRFTEQVQVRKFLSEVRVEPNSSLVGKTLAESGLGAKDNVNILRIYRLGDPLPSPGPGSRIEAGDVLLLQGQTEDLLRIRAERNLRVQEEGQGSDALLQLGEPRVMQAIVAPGCRHAGHTLREIGFRAQFGLNVLALWRHGEVYPLGLKEIPLRVGDVLVLQGADSDFERFRREGDFLLTEEVPQQTKSAIPSLFTVIVFALSLICPALGVCELSVSLLTGALLLMLGGVVNPKECYESIDWSTIVFFVGMLALASAWAKSNLDQYLASWVQSFSLFASYPVLLFLLLYFLAAGLSQIARKMGAVILVAPIALAFAANLQVPAHPFLLCVWMGSASAFLSWRSEQVNSLVMGPGGYRAGDFFKAGFPLLLLNGALTALLASSISGT